MGSKCCTERVNRGPEKAQVRKSVSAFASGDKKRAISIGYHSKGDDADKFDRAFETNDLKAFVALLASNQVIESFEERMHPWAEDPKTVGALAGTQLAILASVGEKDNPSVKDEIREAGAIPPLVKFLDSDQVDRVQTAVVALNFLTGDCPENSTAAYEAHAVEKLVPHLESKIGGMRAATATTLRNIFVENDEYRKKFFELGGLKGLVGQLGASPDPALNHADVQLDSILNLQDMIEDENGGIIEEYAKSAIEAGAEAKLIALTSSDDEEVQTCAQEVLDQLAKVKPSMLR